MCRGPGIPLHIPGRCPLPFVPHSNPAHIVTRDGFMAELVGSRNGKEHWRLHTDGFWMDVSRAVDASVELSKWLKDKGPAA